MSKETGGPAFPVETKLNRVNNEAWPFQTQNGDIFQFPGMTIRDHFAGLAMQGDMSFDPLSPGIDDERLQKYVNHYYRIADAMIAARKQ